MAALIFLAAYLACCRVAYLLMRSAWLSTLDFTKADRSLHIALSVMGPISLMAGVCIYLTSDARPGSTDVLIKRNGSRP